MRRLLLTFCVPLTCATWPPLAFASDEPSPDFNLCQFTPVFSDDFDTLNVSAWSLGAARWTAHTPWNGDFGDAAFADPGPNGPFSVSNGILSITATKNAQGRWHSGLLAAADGTGAGAGVKYGYFEARMRFPPGPGTWPAFWLGTLKPKNSPDPGIEIDIVEYYGHSTTNYWSSIHFWSKEPGKSRHTSHSTPVPADALTNAFHTYGAKVLPDTITLYLDRKPVWQFPTPPELQAPLFPLVNLALGSGFPIKDTPSPSVLLVDYVHVYHFDPQGPRNGCHDLDNPSKN